jgi:hypothetical protein
VNVTFGSNHHRTKFALVLLACAVLLAGASYETYRVYAFFTDISAAREELVALEKHIDLSILAADEVDLLQDRADLVETGKRLKSARSFVRSDPLLFVATNLPLIGNQAQGLQTLVAAADESTQAGIIATDVALAFSRYKPDAESKSLKDALGFMRSQEGSMANLRTELEGLHRLRAELPTGLLSPMAGAAADFEHAVQKLDGIVQGYERANSLLPTMLGIGGTADYLLLFQNNTELFPSGGLISSYGVLQLHDGSLTGLDVEYFLELYRRWQKESGGEYVEPPGPLKRYLLRDSTWALGEAGWYPDFATTSRLANDFVRRGGTHDTTGTIAIDMQFTRELLELLGPVRVSEYDVTVSATNFNEVALEYTRNEGATSDEASKAFLSYLARELVKALFDAPKETWPDLLQFLDRMGEERHLQLHFDDAVLQELSAAYGFDGALRQPGGDFLLIANTSVNGTKLNLILEPRARLEVTLRPDGDAKSALQYAVKNPFSEWATTREADFVNQLMGHGVYGCYLRAYVPSSSRLVDLRLNSDPAGAEQIEVEFGKSVFGRFFTVLPDTSTKIDFEYETPGVVRALGGDTYVYSLYIQKQAGTKAMPLTVEVEVPRGAELLSSRLDGKATGATTFITDLRVDRKIEVTYRLR